MLLLPHDFSTRNQSTPRFFYLNATPDSVETSVEHAKIPRIGFRIIYFSLYILTSPCVWSHYSALKDVKMVYLNLRGKKLLAGITISSGLGFILFGTELHH